MKKMEISILLPFYHDETLGNKGITYLTFIMTDVYNLFDKPSFTFLFFL